MASRPKTDWVVSFADLFGTWSGYAFDAWILMLLLGTLHSQDRAVPPLGFWYSLFAAWVLITIVGSGTFSISQRIRKLVPDYGKKKPVASATDDWESFIKSPRSPSSN